MDFRRQKYFLAVATHKGFCKAAVALNVSQPALSQQIRSLEEDLGFALFDRSRRATALTPAGEDYKRSVETLIGDYERSVAAAREKDQHCLRSLTLGVNTLLLVSHLPAIKYEFTKCYPDARFELRVHGSSAILQHLARRQIDVVLTGQGCDIEGLVAEPIWHMPIQIALPRDHPLAARAQVDLRDLAGETLFVPPIPSSTLGQHQAVEICRAQGLLDFRIHEVAEDKSSLAMLGFVAAGFGFALLPSAYHNLLSDRVAFRRIKGVRQEIPIAAFYRRDSENPMVLDFIDMARRCVEPWSSLPIIPPRHAESEIRVPAHPG